MKRFFFLAGVGWLLCLRLISSQEVRFAFTPGGQFKIIERSDLRTWENGRYLGYIYREDRAILKSTTQAAAGELAGKYYLFEELKQDQRPVAKKVDDVFNISLRVEPSGEYRVPAGQHFPALGSFPFFPDKPLKAGDKWQAYGYRFVDPRRNGTYTKVRFYCDYTYKGLAERNGEKNYWIRGEYALRYKAGQDPNGDPDLLEIRNGGHVVDVYISQNRQISLFMRDNVRDPTHVLRREEYVYRDGSTVSVTGVILTWINPVPQLDKQQVAQAITDSLDDSGTKDVEVTKAEQGVALTLNRIHFIADQAQILPEEKSRLDSLAHALKLIKNRTFLVIGHTADVGSKESQYTLSVERAKAVVDALIQRGIAPARFIYEGKGGAEPVAPNDSEENRKQNRRVEIIILED